VYVDCYGDPPANVINAVDTAVSLNQRELLDCGVSCVDGWSGAHPRACDRLRCSRTRLRRTVYRVSGEPLYERPVADVATRGAGHCHHWPQRRR
jgi:hypothetical protein